VGRGGGPVRGLVIGAVDVLAVGNPARGCATTAVAHRRGMHCIVIAGVSLPRMIVPAQAAGDIVDGIEGLGLDVVALNAGAVADVERVRHGGTEVHALTTMPGIPVAVV